MNINKPTTLATSIALITLITLSACSAAAPAATTNLPALRVGVTQWIGFAPIYIARDKGFFAQEGVKVDVVSFDAYDAQNAAFASKKVDGGVTVLSDTIAQAAANIQVQGVWFLDESK